MREKLIAELAKLSPMIGIEKCVSLSQKQGMEARYAKLWEEVDKIDGRQPLKKKYRVL